MNKQRPFSKLKKTIDNLFDEKLKMEFCCNSYPIRGQWGHHNSIPRFYLKMDKEIIWDFPKDFEVKDFPFYYWAGNNNITDLISDYINTPIAELLAKTFQYDTHEFVIQQMETNNQSTLVIEYKLVTLFKAADRRLGKEQLLNWALQISNATVDRIIDMRYNKA